MGTFMTGWTQKKEQWIHTGWQRGKNEMGMI